MDHGAGLRERKKAATRRSLHLAALRLTAEQGFDRITVEAIADAATVSRRTFSNYFSNKEEALLHGDLVRVRRLLRQVRERPAAEGPWTAMAAAAEHLAADGAGRDEDWLRWRRQIRSDPALTAALASVYAGVERDLVDEALRRLGTEQDAALHARVLVATFLAALRVATEDWIARPGRSYAEAVRTTLTLAATPG